MKHVGSVAVTAALIALAAACAATSDPMVIGSDCDGGFCRDTPPPFEAPEAGPAATELTNYCPSNRCPTGYTTCSSSRFVCDVDLRSDRDNCGACDSACPANTDAEFFDCIDGRCSLRCRNSHADCDGILDNGCETHLGVNGNCRACGDDCSGLPCLPPASVGNREPVCGCPDGYTYCAAVGSLPPTCARLPLSNTNCGACRNECDSTGGPGAPPPSPNSAYGCVDSQCGRLKCNEGWADCNGDFRQPGSDGCETELNTHDNCTMCGDNCSAKGMNCVYTPFEGTACRCPAGTNFCGVSVIVPFIGDCADFASDSFNCGACGHACPGITLRSRGICSYGVCKLQCTGRWADCNGNPDDDCETDTFGDPQNCGGCGIACDLAAGQACAGGRCVVEPCEGEEAR